MIRTFLSDDDHAALLRALDAAHIDAGVATEVLNAAEDAACMQKMLLLFELGRVTPVLGPDGQLRWNLSEPVRTELGEMLAAAALREAL